MTDFQSRSTKIGAAYEQQVADWLGARGFSELERHVRHASGVEFDIYARSPFGDLVGIECKASDDTAPEHSRGMRRGDNRWKVLGYLYALRVWRQQGNDAPRYMLFTSDMPEPGTDQRRILDLAEALGDLTIIVVPWEGVDA